MRLLVAVLALSGCSVDYGQLRGARLADAGDDSASTGLGLDASVDDTHGAVGVPQPDARPPGSPEDSAPSQSIIDSALPHADVGADAGGAKECSATNSSNGPWPPPPPTPTMPPQVLASFSTGPAELALTTDGIIYASVFLEGAIYTVDTRTTPPAIAMFASGLSQPAGLLLDGKRNLLVAERAANRVVALKLASPTERQVLAAGFQGPWAIALDDCGNVFVANELGSGIDRIAPDGTVTRGVIKDVQGATGLAFDFMGRLLVTVHPNSGTRLNIYGRQLQLVKSLDGFSSPVGVASDRDGNIYVANNTTGTVDRIDAADRRSTFVSGLNGPHGLAFDTRGALYVAEMGTKLLRFAAP